MTTKTEWDQIALVKQHAENRHPVQTLGCPVCTFMQKHVCKDAYGMDPRICIECGKVIEDSLS